MQITIMTGMSKTTKDMTTEGTGVDMITIVVEDFQVEADTSGIGRTYHTDRSSAIHV